MPLPPAHAAIDGDRDIVYSALALRRTGHFYAGYDQPPARRGKPDEEILEPAGPFHLWRINPDGSGRTRITAEAHADDTEPRWSPDGRSILFVRSTPLPKRRGFDEIGSESSVCVLDVATNRLRTLLRLPVRETNSPALEGDKPVTYCKRDGDWIYPCVWSPDGRSIALVTGSDDRFDPDAPCRLLVLDAATGRILHRTERILEFSWRPDGRALYVSEKWGEHGRWLDARTGAATAPRADSPQPLLNVGWLNPETMIADTSNGTELLTADGRRKRSFEWTVVNAYTGRAYENAELPAEAAVARRFPEQERRWFALSVSGKNAVLAATRESSSGGGRFAVFRADFATQKSWLLHQGELIAVSPDGRRCAVATGDWVGPYKRGGARCGPLEVISTQLSAGAKVHRGRPLTAALTQFAGGDWRKPAHC